MRFKSLPSLAVFLALAGCSTGDYRLFHPLNQIAGVEWWSTLFEVGIMSLIIVPVTILIAVFIWRYRKSANAAYDPSFTHSLTLEILVWGVPLIIVIICGVVSIRTIHEVDPYAPGVLAAQEVRQPPLDVDVITTDWQWLFIYPAQHVAAIDELVVPQGRVVHLRLTSTSVTNDFFIPGTAPMIDVMPGMRTEDTFDAATLGTSTGFSADFSGAGFSWMQFATRIVPQAAFNAWAATAAASPNQLSYAAFTRLAQPTVNEGARVSYFSAPDPQLFDKVVGAAQAGVVYPVSNQLTRSIASLDDPAEASGAATK
ncbi:ubiquinol oxidase subunit II [Acidocella sp.]|uniref:ubiquinol oxidase subunit II n=1 Tax=Acidocella sp. TaxID=50710 RepID=UPI002613B088|nr:ubiquinol oxidase subunit II [Acidocella sp.]